MKIGFISCFLRTNYQKINFKSMGGSLCAKDSQIASPQGSFDYDLFVIGGGSGGLAAASAASKYGAKVALADYVKPSPGGTSWGLGGTCVNVGCIPKKLFHYAALLGESIGDLTSAGWSINQQPKHNWQKLSDRITAYIRSLNFAYKKTLNTDNVTYFNALASLSSKHTLELTSKDGSKQVLSAKYILIATGGRPTRPGIPGQQYAISSDDIFWRREAPGKVLVVGASYIALECGGYLKGLGCDVNIMVRSILLRGFDQQIAGKIGEYMQNMGINFIKEATPISISLTSSGKRRVTFTHNKQQHTEEYDTVLFAIGRSADTQGLNLQNLGVKLAPNGKIIASDNDATSVSNIFSIGDVCNGRLELTPTAIMAGKLLAARMFNKSNRIMSYKYVPTTVFTPIQYGVVGYSEEEAIGKFGKDNIIAYGSSYRPAEWNLNQERTSYCYAKIVVNKSQQNKIVGLHFLGPNAGEVTQGFAVAILKGITKQDLDYSVGIHPTLAQEFTLLKEIAGSANEQKSAC